MDKYRVQHIKCMLGDIMGLKHIMQACKIDYRTLKATKQCIMYVLVLKPHKHTHTLYLEMQ